MPRRELLALFCEEFDREDVSLGAIKALYHRKGWKTGRSGCFSKGARPHNKGMKGFCAPGSEKGWFKPGTLSGSAAARVKPVGFERLSKEGYVERKIHDGLPMQSRWRAVHLINWEALNGPIPDGHCLKCQDGNKANTDPSNWVLIPRAMLPRLAGRWALPFDQAEPEVKPLVMALAKLQHRKRQAKSARRKHA